MSVEVKTTSRAKSALIALGVLLLGLAIIFAIRHYRDVSQEQSSRAQGVESTNLQP